MWSLANSVTLNHFIINSAANDLTGEQSRTTASIWDVRFLKGHIETQQIHFLHFVIFLLLCDFSYTYGGIPGEIYNYCILTLFTFQHTNKQSIDRRKKSALV